MNTSHQPTTLKTMAASANPRKIWTTGIKSAVVAAASTECYAFAARALGVSMKAGSLGATTAEPIPVGSFTMGTLICVLWGTVIAAALARWSKQPARTFTTAAVVLTLVSLIGPIAAGSTTAATKAMLVGAHLLAALIVIPAIARRLPDHD
jgi:Family of unknown function (DUF6069)